MRIYEKAFDRGLSRRRLFSVIGGSIIAFVALTFGTIAVLSHPTGAASSYWQSTEQTASGSRAWKSIDSSTDGTKLAAAVASGYIYTSTDSGATWTEQTASGSRAWKSITSSSDGTRLAAATVSGYIFTSTDSGANWTQQTNSGSRNWADVDSSADGLKLIAAVTGTSGSRSVYTSVNGGANWTQMTNLPSSVNWKAVAISGDGNSIAAANSNGYFNGRVLISRDAGANWETGFGYRDWTSIAFSNDGSRFVAVSHDEQMFIYRDGQSDPWDIANFTGDAIAVALSGDGTTIAIARPSGEIAISADYGATWSDQAAAGSKSWTDVALSSDGKKLAATASTDYIYTGSIVYSSNAPTNLSGVAGDGEASLSWTAPTNNGGTAITDYKVEYSYDGGSQWSEYSHSASTATAQTVTGLANGYEYIFRVRAINVAGEGDISNLATGRPLSPSTIAGPSQTINVTSTTDEDSAGSAGAGCSLREAIIASNTAQAYGGCVAGGGANDTIYLLDGEYAFGNQGSSDLYVYGASIVGQSVSGTTISNLSFIFASDAAIGISNLTISSNGPAGNLTLLGSNKSITNINSTGGVAVTISFGNQSRTITDTTISYYSTDGTADAAPIQCTAICTGTVVEDSTFSSSQASQLNLGDDAIITNTTLTALSNIELTVGINSVLNNVSLVGQDVTSTYSSVTLGAGTTVDDLSITGSSSINLAGSAASLHNIEESGGYVSNYIAADEVDGFVITATSNVDFTTTNQGNEIKNLVINTTASSNSVYVKPALFDGFDFNGSGTSSLNLGINASADATISNISITGTDDFNGSITGDDLVINDIEVVSSGMDSLDLTGANPTISDIDFTNVSLSLSNALSPTLERVSLDGSDNYGGALSFNDDIEDVLIKDSFIKNSLYGGILMSPNTGAGSSLTIQNTQIENAGTSSDSYGALYASDVQEVTLEGVTITGGQQQNQAAVMISGGLHHTITNTTITGANGGIAISGSGSNSAALELTINNSTIVDNVANDLISWVKGGVSLSALPSQTVHATVTNSIIGGNGGGQCSFDGTPGDATMVTGQNSIASDSSCGAGFTVVADVGDVVDLALDDNGSEAPSIGYSRQFGKVQTLALTTASPALGTGAANTCADYDARGFERDTAIGCDIGAYQFNIVTAPVDNEGGGAGSGITSGPTANANNFGNAPRSSNGVAVVTDKDTFDSEKTSAPEGSSPVKTTDANNNNAAEVTEATTERSFPLVAWIIGGVLGIFIVIAAIIAVRRKSSN